MSETTTTEQAGEPQVYRPISGLAIAGFALALVFAGIALLGFVAALFQQGPFFLDRWTFALPIAGALLGYLGQNQIRHAEGTRAGLKLARWAIGLSVVVGLMSATYSFVTELALRHQANAFLMEEGPDSGFFPHLVGANKKPIELDRAFLLALDTGERLGARPGDEKRMQQQYDIPDAKGYTGTLFTFRSHPFVVRLANANPDKTKIEPLGVQDWNFVDRRYHLTRLYRITTPEAIIEVPIKVMSSEGAEGEQRKWFVFVPEPTSAKITKTRLGELIESLGKLSLRYLENWISDLNAGMPFADFQAKNKTQWPTLATKELTADVLRERMTQLFERSDKGRLLFQRDPKDTPSVESENGRLQFGHNFRLVVGPMIGLPPLNLFGVLVVQSKEPFDPEAGGDSPAWEIHSIRIQRVAPITALAGAQK